MATAPMTDPNKAKKTDAYGRPLVTPNMLGNIPDVTPSVTSYINQPGVVNTGQAQQTAGQAQTAIQNALTQAPNVAQKTVDLASGRLAGTEATESQQTQDLLGKAGLAGSARGISQQANLMGQQGQRREQELLAADISGQEQQRKGLETALSSALGFTQAGVTEQGQKAETALGLAGLGSAERQTGAEIAGRADVAQTQEEGATTRTGMNISQGNKEAFGFTDAQGNFVPGSLNIADRTQRATETFQAESIKQGWSAEERADKQTFGFDIENPDGTTSHVPGTLEMELQELGITADNSRTAQIEAFGGYYQDGTFVPAVGADGQPVQGKLQIAAENLQIARDTLDYNKMNSEWNRIVAFAETLPPDSGAALVASVADQYGLPKLNTIPDDMTAQGIQQRADATGVSVQEQAIKEGFMWLGDDGMTVAKTGDASLPRTFNAEEYPSDRLGLNSNILNAMGEWKTIASDGEHVKFDKPMKSDYGFDMKAGEYQFIKSDGKKVVLPDGRVVEHTPDSEVMLAYRTDGENAGEVYIVGKSLEGDSSAYLLRSLEEGGVIVR